MPVVEVSCEQCKAKFMPMRIAHGGLQRFCSAKCCRVGYKAKRPKRPRVVMPRKVAQKELSYHKIENRTCDKCSVEFQVMAYQNNRFCSKRCAKSYYNSVRFKAKLDRRTGNLFNGGGCEICGYDRRVDRAHILPAKSGWKLAPWNVLRLCPNHHTAFDDGKLTMDELCRLGIGWLAA